MTSVAHLLIKEYLNFGGKDKSLDDFNHLRKKINWYMFSNSIPKEYYIKLQYILNKLEYGVQHAIMYGGTVDIEISDTEETIEEYWKKYKEDYCKEDNKEIGKLKEKKSKVKQELGKLVDEGNVPYPDRSDAYWNKEQRLKVIFQPGNREIRTGPEIPKSYFFADMKFLEAFYDLRAIEFGNWLSQQDRVNYVAGLGLALYDLHRVIDFKPHQISLGGKLSVAFGARGRGSALAHFEPETFAINITRYSRPKKGSHNHSGFKRIKLLTASGGVGSFAHEFAHALDYYAGKYIKVSKGGALSHGRSTRIYPDKKLMLEINSSGQMERLLNKIIWKSEGKHSAYYERLLKNKTLTKYYFYRNELFARAFEVYIQYKMAKRKYKNIFLAETKYASDTYLTLSEMKGLEKNFDQLINAIKWKIKLK